MPNERELGQTTILAVPLDEASAKIRTGQPKDEEEDYVLPVWAGVVPLATVPGEPEPDPAMSGGIDEPGYLRPYRR